MSYAPARPWLAAGMVVALFALKSLSVVFPTWILAVVSARLFPLPAALAVCAAGVAVEVSIPYWISRLSGAQALERLVEKHPKVRPSAPSVWAATSSLPSSAASWDCSPAI